jgi:oxygen-dependent protoporphyrinogen oxidase
MTEQDHGPGRLVVIGGGISGLAAAHRLVERCRTERLPFEVLLLEAESRLGGAIATIHRDGFLLEAGPDAFITAKPWGLDLVQRLGLSDRLIGTEPAHRRMFVVRDSALHAIPEGFVLLAPTRLLPFLRSRLLSWRGKLRTALDLLLPRGDPAPDESLAAFVRRRFGEEAVARLAQPVVAGIYAADPERLSLRATMPQFLDMESRARSVILGLRRQQATRAAGQPDAGARYSLFATLADGLQTLVDALASRLPKEAIHHCCQVRRLRREASVWTLDLDDRPSLTASGVILAVPAFRAAALLAGLDPVLARELEAVPYASSVTVNLAYRREAIGHPLDGFGFVVPSCEGRSILACSFSSVKFAGRAPAGYVLLRAFTGGALQPEAVAWDDRDLLASVCRDLADLLGIRSAPLWTHIARYPRSMPQYQVGHLARVTAIEGCLGRWPALRLAGNAYRGVGIPDAIHSGEAAADALLTELAPARAPGCAEARR